MSGNDPLVLLPSGLLLLLVLARVSRARRGLRPLIAPLALTVGGLAVAALVAGTVWPASPWLALVVLAPLLALVVRGVSLAFQWGFHRRQGMPPPALLDSVISVLIYAVGIGLIAHRWFGLALTPFLATSAVVGAVVGLALQDTLGNLFAGIALHSEAPFRVGDWVRVGDRDGRIEQVSWRALRLRTWDGDTLVVPNNDVARNAVLNYSEPSAPHSRVVLLRLSYQTPPDRVLEVLRAAVAQVDGLPAHPPAGVRILSYEESAVCYEVRYFFSRYEDYRRAEGEILRLAWYHLRRASVEVPVAVRNVYLHQRSPAAEEADPASRLVAALRHVELFQPLAEDQLRRAATRFRPLRYAEGEKVIEEGAPGDSFFLVDQGTVKVLKLMGGRTREMARLGPGSFFGEMALLTGEQRSATVVALEDTSLFVIDKGGFHDILLDNPEVAVEISSLLAARRQALTQAAGEVTTPMPAEAGEGELKDRLLARIRSYFGL